MTGSFSLSSTDLVLDISEAQGLNAQSQAQQSLPQGVALGVWSVSEHTFSTNMPQITSFVAHEQELGHLVLAWTVPDSSTPDASGPPTLYLNNAAATYYGLSTVPTNKIDLYRPQELSSQDTATVSRFVEEARLNASLGAGIQEVTVAVHDQQDAAVRLPEDLPAVSSFLSDEHTTTRDCLIAVVPDAYFAPTDYLSAITQGAAVFTDQTVFSLREGMQAHHVENLVGRFTPVGAGDAAAEPTTRRLVLHVLVLLCSAVGAVTGAGLAARAWAQATHRRREIALLLGASRWPDHALTAALVTLPVLVLAWPLLGSPPGEHVAIQATCALALAAASIIGARPPSARFARRLSTRTSRDG